MNYFSESLNRYIVLSVIFMSLFSSCETNAGLVDCFPRSDINIDIKIELPLYQDIGSVTLSKSRSKSVSNLQISSSK